MGFITDAYDPSVGLRPHLPFAESAKGGRVATPS